MVWMKMRCRQAASVVAFVSLLRDSRHGTKPSVRCTPRPGREVNADQMKLENPFHPQVFLRGCLTLWLLAFLNYFVSANSLCLAFAKDDLFFVPCYMLNTFAFVFCSYGARRSWGYYQDSLRRRADFAKIIAVLEQTQPGILEHIKQL